MSGECHDAEPALSWRAVEELLLGTDKHTACHVSPSHATTAVPGASEAPGAAQTTEVLLSGKRRHSAVKSLCGIAPSACLTPEGGAWEELQPGAGTAAAECLWGRERETDSLTPPLGGQQQPSPVLAGSGPSWSMLTLKHPGPLDSHPRHIELQLDSETPIEALPLFQGQEPSGPEPPKFMAGPGLEEVKALLGLDDGEGVLEDTVEGLRCLLELPPSEAYQSSTSLGDKGFETSTAELLC